MSLSLRRWLHISFFNLLIVAFIGVVLRYKIAFSLPFVDQKHLLHGHSHFAFSGWITQVMMVLMIQYLAQPKGEAVFKRYRWLLWANLLCAYGMLISFPLQGYGMVSIFFSTLSIVNGYLFAVWYWKDLNRLEQKNISHYWFKAALLFSVISSYGAFSLASMMANHVIHQNWYLAAEYYFLHFQYNGWFFFAGMGLLMAMLHKMELPARTLRTIFWLFFLACIPAYFLSALWMPMPKLIYWLVIASAIAQCAGWGILLGYFKKNRSAIKLNIPAKGRQILLLSATALTIKLVLQLGSTHPALSQLAFGFRPIVIAYLHLVLLGVITIFIIGYIISSQLLLVKKYYVTAVWIFIAGIIINEMLLMLQGVTGLSYTIIPYMNECLLLAALIMFSGTLMMNVNLRNLKL